jgi:hypothetical protein
MNLIFCPDVVKIIMEAALADLAADIRAVFAAPLGSSVPQVTVVNSYCHMAAVC